MLPTAPFALASWRTGPAAMRASDIFAVLVALTLPWSTTASAIATALWAASLVPGADRAALVDTLRHPASLPAIALFALGTLGMLWADVPWTERLAGLERFLKLLTIPLLLYHFRRSERGYWVLATFLASCTVVLAASWVQFVFPQLARSPYQIGVPVKNYIVQSQEFALCVFVLAYLSLKFFREGRAVLGAGAAALGSVFLLNMLFVASSRTALLVLAVLFALFCVACLRGRTLAWVALAAVLVAATAWSTSDYLRHRVTDVLTELQLYQSGTGLATSAGQRLEYWRKSLQFVAEAPLLGHGTGSIRSRFERAAVGQTGVAAEVVNNPHNQTLAVAVQLGLIGVIALYAMWFVHLRLFAGGGGLAGWIGLAAVVQNVTSSLLNSHLFDSAEGWIYVLAVGIAGGMVLKVRGAPPAMRP